jgi:transcriptional regulator with XRE-family HTH domain
MEKFGETIRNLRVAQNLGLREMAIKVGISPAYLSRIERNKESPPRPEIIKALAKTLAADPDVLFRLTSSTDPEMVNFLNNNPMVSHLIRTIKETSINEKKLELIIGILKQES